MRDHAQPSSSLRGLRALITRPEPSNRALADAVERRDGEAVCLPAIETEPVDRPALVGQLAQTRDVGLVIFVSVPAVAHGSCLLTENHVRGRQVAAIGSATAKALASRGIRVDITPENDTYTTEALLGHPALAHPEDQSEVLIVRGVGGRELLASTLGERGFDVRYAQAYVRRRPGPERAVAARAAIRSAGAPHIITATSLEILDNTLLLLGAEADLVRSSSHVIAPSRRIAQAAMSVAGFKLPPLTSRGADNEALLSAMEAWWGSRR
ncbi:MAG: uroporphyrinogen-III synthase [Pseudomonadota bacterium]